MLPENLKREIARKFAIELRENVTLVFFSSELSPECQDTRLLLRDLVELSEKLRVIDKNHMLDKPDAEQFGVDKIPAIVPLGKNGKDYGMRFFGTPNGYELGSLLEAIRIISLEKSEISQVAQLQIQSIGQPLHIQVFSTPTCPYCPKAVQLALHAALLNPAITAAAINVEFYPSLATRYGVHSVPKTVINDKIEFNGALSESDFVTQLLATTTIP